VFPQRGKFVSNPSTKPRDTQRAVSNKSQLARLKTLETRKPPPGKKVRVVPRSASRPYIRHKSINVYANFKRPAKKGERATTKDLAGRKIRTRNYQTPRPGLVKAPRVNTGKKRVGDRPFSGPSGSYKSISGKNGGAWVGDISNRRIRSRSGKQPSGGSGLFVRNRSATRTGRAGASVRPPGSASGKRWNNNGIPVPVRAGKVNTSGFPGKYKLFQNRPGFGNQGENYSGAIKRRGAQRARVDVSGYPGKIKLFQNRPGFSNQGEEYSGAIKLKRPAKGGGSVSGKLWNNDGNAIPGKSKSQRGINFAGNIKAKRPAKGGGSVSGKLWNNNATPIPTKAYSSEARKVSGYPGKMKLFEAQPGFNDQGEEFTGYIKLSRLKRNYVQNKKAHDESIKKRKPEKEVYAVEGLQVKVKRRDYVRNKNAADEALRKLQPTKTDRAVADLQVKVRQYNYRHNPSSADEALKVREPGKAFARATDYQGNIKMQRYKIFEKNRSLHPDARFVRTNKNNVDGERDALTNLKLWWARLFKKQEAQPDHLKEKLKKPRYDKGEQGLWYD
jgi:hypothetical protein